MTPDNQISENTLPENAPLEEARAERQTVVDPVIGPRPLSNFASSIGTTEEKLASYADRTLEALWPTDASLDVSFLKASIDVPQEDPVEPSTEKIAESDILERESANPTLPDKEHKWFQSLPKTGHTGTTSKLISSQRILAKLET